MATRLSQTESDRAGRWQHFRDGLALSGTGAGFWLGQGLGRYVDLYALHHDPKTRPGDLRLVQGEPGPLVRTVAGNHALYFDGPDPSALSKTMSTWLSLHTAGKTPTSHDMPWQSWKQSAAQLLRLMSS